jgi:LPS-assembly protein
MTTIDQKIILASFWMALTVANLTYASLNTTDNSIELQAKNVEYRGENGEEIIAKGDVEIIQSSIRLFADEVKYTSYDDKVVATGSIKIIEPDGYIVTAKEIELKNKLRVGAIHHFKVKFPDNSILVGETLEQVDNNIRVMRESSFTPCKTCKDEQPQWQIKAKEVKLDKEQETVTYKHAFFEVYGVPIFYTPYFQHPTQGAKRKTGFLKPEFGKDTYLGNILEMPYYFNVAPNIDDTAKITYTSKQGMHFNNEFRYLTRIGQYKLDFSIAEPKFKDGKNGENGNTRFHIGGNGDFSLDDQWSAGFNFKRSSDKSYLKDYKYGEDDYLTSKLYLNFSDNRNYARITGLSFQDLRTDGAREKSPLVAPIAEYHWESGKFSNGSRLLLDANVLSLSREMGASDDKKVNLSKMDRITNTLAWKMPYMSTDGHIFGIIASVRGDAYYVEDARTQQFDSYTGSETRILPELVLDWSFPLVNKVEGSTILIEPIASIIFAKNGEDSKNIPNEDSHYVELSDSNIFTPDRTTGLDLVELGSRINYGVKTTVLTPGKNRYGMLLGQTYNTVRKKKVEFQGSGIEDNYSDFVGRVSWSKLNKFELVYKFTADKRNFKLKRNEIGAAYHFEKLYVKTNFVSLNDERLDIDNVKNRKEIYGEVGITGYKNWRFMVNARRNLTSKKHYRNLDVGYSRWIKIEGKISHLGDCVDFSTSLVKDYTSKGRRKSSTTVWFNVSFKNIS